MSGYEFADDCDLCPSGDDTVDFDELGDQFQSTIVLNPSLFDPSLLCVAWNPGATTSTNISAFGKDDLVRSDGALP